MGKFYITTAIDYVNGPPHIGHAIQKVWADVIARNRRFRGDDVWFLTGTDEHGVNVVRTAESSGKTPQELADMNAAKFRSMREALDLSWDDFIQTTDHKRHWPGATLLWQRLLEAGDIYKKRYRGFYCAGHEAFITQKDLVDGKCLLHKKAPEVIDEENYFFKLSKYSEKIRDAIQNDIMRIVPVSRKNEIIEFIKTGLEDVSFSRPTQMLSWGIPVPNDADHVMYVWCDALTNYISAIGYGRDDGWQKWWPADLHVLGKDNLRFHAAIWPGMLLAAGLELPKSLFVHGFITVDGQKMSKTVGNVVDPFALVRQYGTDPVRYYFLREVPSYDDGDFSHQKFEERYASDLANGLGNFVARVLTLAAPVDFAGMAKAQESIIEKIEKAKNSVAQKIDEYKFHEALAAIWNLIGFGDSYVNDKKPWAMIDEKEKKKALFDLVTILGAVALLLGPFLPNTAKKINDSIVWDGSSLTVKKPDNLFPRLETSNK
ncbi:methionine--tRNA ligase [Candidatus Jorgensenbacteria bacterium]|nr:methionine--tRNA ligase [Candidatus Jorgensenbacteria bacterium]